MSTALALALTLASSASWAGLDAARKRLAGSMSAIALVVWLSLGQAPVFGAWWAYTGGTLAADGVGIYVGIAAIALLLNVIANVGFVRAVHISDLSTTVPMMAFAPVFTAAIANPLLGERPSWQAIAGIVAVVFGALLLTFTPPERSEAEDGERPGALRWIASRFSDRGAMLMLMVAACWSTTMVLDKLATEYAPLPMHALVINAGVGLSLAVFLVVRGEAKQLSEVREDLPGMGAAVLLGAGAFGFQLGAIQGLMVGAVETIKRAIGMLSSIVVGRIAFGEAVTVRKVIAALIMCGGTAAIMLGNGPT